MQRPLLTVIYWYINTLDLLTLVKTARREIPYSRSYQIPDRKKTDANSTTISIPLLLLPLSVFTEILWVGLEKLWEIIGENCPRYLIKKTDRQYSNTIDRVKVLSHTRHKIGHFVGVHSSQSLA